MSSAAHIPNTPHPLRPSSTWSTTARDTWPWTPARAGPAIRARPRWPRRLLPLWGMLVAAGLIVSRRPDAIAHAQFWAEDGKLFYADVYERGLLATLTVPQSGYFQELPILAAGIAQLAPLALAPLVMNLLAIAVRVLPVGLLLSRRAQTIAPDVRVRALLAALYIGLPGAPELNANADNALWFMAVGALIVLMLRPPLGRAARALDLAAVALCGVTGVFAIALAPLALLYRRARPAVSRLTLAILGGAAALQLLAIFVLQHHLPGGFGAAPRVYVPLHATVGRLFYILGARVIAEPLLGNSVTLGAPVATALGVAGAIGAIAAFCHASAELRLTLGFGGLLFAMTLARPIGVSWPELTAFPTGGRYFIVPQLAFAATLVWAVAHLRNSHWRMAPAGLLACMCLVAIPSGWRYPAFHPHAFARQAALFERAPRGTRITFHLEPRPWSMTLVKR